MDIKEDKLVDFSNEETIVGLDEDSSPKMITIECGTEKQPFYIEKDYLNISKLFVRVFEQDPTTTVIQSTSVTPSVFSEILKYMNHHKGVDPPVIEYPAKSANMSENCNDPWDATFIDTLWNQSKKLYYEVFNTANFLEIQSLVYLCACKIGTVIINCTSDNVANVLIPENVSK